MSSKHFIEISAGVGGEGLYHSLHSEQLKIPFGVNTSYSLGSGMEVAEGAQGGFLKNNLLYFAGYNALPCTMYIHVFVRIIHRIIIPIVCSHHTHV